MIETRHQWWSCQCLQNSEMCIASVVVSATDSSSFNFNFDFFIKMVKSQDLEAVERSQKGGCLGRGMAPQSAFLFILLNQFGRRTSHRRGHRSRLRERDGDGGRHLSCTFSSSRSSSSSWIDQPPHCLFFGGVVPFSGRYAGV